MNISIEGEQTLLGLFMPSILDDLKEFLEEWRPLLHEPCKSLDFEKWVYLEFDFNGLKKQIVYRLLARSIIYGWLKDTNVSALARYMAEYSNLNTSKSMKTREHSIRQGINRYLPEFEKVKQFRKEHGGIIITTRKRYLPTDSDAGAGNRVNQDW